MMLITHPITWWLGVITHPKRRQIYTRIIETNSYACLTIFASRLNRTVINCIPSAHKFALKTTGGSSWYKHSIRYWAAKKRQLFDLNLFIAFYYICVLNNMNIWGFFSTNPHNIVHMWYICTWSICIWTKLGPYL